MKKSEMTVSMSLLAFEEYENYKKKFTELTNNLSGCFDDTLLKAGCSQSVDFDVKKSLEICKSFMPYSMKDADIEIKL